MEADDALKTKGERLHDIALRNKSYGVYALLFFAQRRKVKGWNVERRAYISTQRFTARQVLKQTTCP